MMQCTTPDVVIATIYLPAGAQHEALDGALGGCYTVTEGMGVWRGQVEEVDVYTYVLTHESTQRVTAELCAIGAQFLRDNPAELEFFSTVQCTHSTHAVRIER